MELPQEVEDYIKETINDSLGLPISTQTLQLKLRASEDTNRRLRDQYLLLLDKLRHKDQLIDRARAEASMNAVAVKKFVEENQRLAAECANLVNQCNKWEKECSLYDRDREALMDFGNEADERAKEAEFKVGELEEMLGKMYEELKFYKHEYETRARGDNSSCESTDMEQDLLESILSTLVCKDEVEFGHAFLEVSSANESCQKLLRMWNSLRPSTQRVLTLVAKVKTLQKDKEHLRINLTTAEEEVNLLFEANKVLDAENKKLLKQHQRNLDGSGGKHTTSASAKGNKRKSSPKMCSPIEMKLESKDVDSMRLPLSPLRQNSPECRMQKK